MSGIEADPEVAQIFNEMKLRSIYKWATFKIENKKLVILDDYLPGDASLEDEADKATWNELAEKLTNEPRYILYDVNTHNPEGRRIQKIFFMFW